jgi:hypothetical protein
MESMKDRIIGGIADDRQVGWVDLRGETLNEFGAAGTAG